MPIRHGTVTFARFRSNPDAKRPSDTRRWLGRSLARSAFEPLDVQNGEEERSAGFVSFDEGSPDFSSGTIEGQWALFGWRVDQLRVPSSAVRAELARWAAAYEKEHGRPPAKGEKATRRDQIRHDFRQRAVPASRIHDVSWNLHSGELLVWAPSRKVIEEIAAAVEGAFELKLAATSAGALAAQAGIAETALGPTAELTGLGAKEVGRVQA